MSSLLTSRWVFTSSNLWLLRSVGQGKLPPPSHRLKKKKNSLKINREKDYLSVGMGLEPRYSDYQVPSMLNPMSTIMIISWEA